MYNIEQIRAENKERLESFSDVLYMSLCSNRNDSFVFDVKYGIDHIVGGPIRRNTRSIMNGIFHEVDNEDRLR